MEVSSQDRRERGGLIGSILADCFAAKWAVDTLDGEEVPARISIARADGVALSRAQMAPMRLRNQRPSDERKYYVYTADRRTLVHVGGARRLCVNPRELLVMRSDLASEWAVDNYYETSSLIFDAGLFEEHIPAHDEVVGRRLRLAPSMQALLGHMIESAWDLTNGAAFETCGPQLGRAFLELFSAALASRVDGTADFRDLRTALDARRLQIKAYIQRNFADPTLNVSSIAKALRISARYAQLAFAAEEDTPSKFMRRVRLDVSATLLSRADERRSITDIAYDCGFGSSSYFSTQFRNHFGMSPREYRNLYREPHALN
jgi:AraC-like DNA-binding protein